jgi:hypothetical protein
MDIYFAVLNFTISGAIAFVGILTLMKVSTPREVLFALLPLLFALHQFVEGFVWLGVGGHIDKRALDIAAGYFIYYAQGVLPFLVPLSLWLIEKVKWRKRLIGILTILGLVLAVYTMYGLATVPSSVSVVNNVLYYKNPTTNNIYVGVTYILTTCGSLMLSSSISIAIFGLLNLIGLIVIYLLRPYGFTSLWCLYAAVVSGMLYFYFIERRIEFLQDLQIKRKEFSKKLELELEHLKKKRLFTKEVT